MALAHPAARRHAAFALLVAAVGLAHALLGAWLLDNLAQLGEGAVRQGPPRLKTQFLAELKPAAPPAVAPRPAVPAPRRKAAAAAAAPAASAAAATPAAAAASAAPAVVNGDEAPVSMADAGASAPAEPAAVAAESPAGMVGPPLTAAASAPAVTASMPAAVDASPMAAVASAAAASAPPSFEWPRSTRLSYRLTGYFRGPVDGQASVEWLREGLRYQVHVEVSVGPSFAPLLSRRMSSDGEIGPDGLSPRRYDEETRVALRSPRRLAVLFDDAWVRLPNGQDLPRPPGVQDAASQFVQLTWLFTTQPQRLRTGESVSLMLALPRRVDTWVYDVLASETLATAAGPIDAVHVRPRRPARPGGDLTAEMWVAPSLQYLPVRIVIRQDAETFVDLLLERLPQQAAEAPPR